MPSPRTKPTLRLTVTKSVFGGDGLAFTGGKACFVEGALPGETVEAVVVHDAKDWLRARAVKVLEISPQRVEPPCPYYGRCGGCQYQHVSYEEELRLKESQLRELFEKIPGAAARTAPILHGPKDYGYRRSATFHLIKKGRNRAELAYISKDNETPLAVKSCHLLDPRLSSVFALTSLPKASKVSYKLSGDGRIVSDDRENFFRVRLLDRQLVANSKAFFQNNWEVTSLLAEKVRGWVRKASAGTFFDLYAGIGTFSFLCAEGITRVFCVEENRYALDALRMNKEELGWTHLRAVEGGVERSFKELWASEGSEDSLILMDPPRTGLAKDLAAFLSAEVRAKTLIYISCDPATLTRDLRTLLAGRWRLEEIVPFDMFPRTKHVEAAALLYYNEG